MCVVLRISPGPGSSEIRIDVQLRHGHPTTEETAGDTSRRNAGFLHYAEPGIIPGHFMDALGGWPGKGGTRQPPNHHGRRRHVCFTQRNTRI